MGSAVPKPGFVLRQRGAEAKARGGATHLAREHQGARRYRIAVLGEIGAANTLEDGHSRRGPKQVELIGNEGVEPFDHGSGIAIAFVGSFG